MVAFCLALFNLSLALVNVVSLPLEKFQGVVVYGSLTLMTVGSIRVEITIAGWFNFFQNEKLVTTLYFYITT